MVLINGGDIFAVKPGTLLCMLSAFSYSINIVLNSYFTRQVDPLALGVYQQGFTCLYSIIGLLVFGSPIFPSTTLDWIRSWTCSLVLSLRIRCTNCCAAIYNTGEYRIPVLPGTDLCSDFFLHLLAWEAHGDGISRGHFHSCRSVYRYRCQKYGNGINHRKIRCRSYIQKIAENPLSYPDMLPLLKIQ